MYQRRTRRDGVMWTVNMHSVLHYDNVGCRGMTMIRDVNARHNIPLILRATPGGGDAEMAFHRSKETTWRQPAATEMVQDAPRHCISVY